MQPPNQSASTGQSCDTRLMPESVQPTLLAALADLVRWLDEQGVPSMIIGGVAASVRG